MKVMWSFSKKKFEKKPPFWYTCTPRWTATAAVTRSDSVRYFMRSSSRSVFKRVQVAALPEPSAPESVFCFDYH